jgi:hypothetical protein
VPGEVPVAFPGDCTQPWTDLDLAWTDLPCRLSVELPESGSFLASAECGEELWQASEGRGPHRVQPGE